MSIVNMHEAKSNLSKLVAAIRAGREREVLIAVNGVPAARLVPLETKRKLAWGQLKGKITVPETINENEAEIEALFTGQGS